MNKIVCPHCGKTLFWAVFANVEIKCERCKKIVKIYINKG